MVAINNRPRPRKGLIGLIGLKKRQNMTIETIMTIEMVADNNRPRPRKGLIGLIGLKKKTKYDH